VSHESKAKLDKYKYISEDEFTKDLDKLVHKKGTESLLALIYADGNSLGQKVKDFMGENISFEDGVNKQRTLTKEINDIYVDAPLKKIKTIVGTHDGKDTGVLKMRRIVGAGDEITIVCNARKAKEVVDAYFDSIDESNKYKDVKYSACIGVAIFNSHAPFSEIYEIAEQCCESGKKRIKDRRKVEGESAGNDCYFDAYFCRGAITGQLNELRKDQSEGRTNMPYCIRGNDIGQEYDDFNRVGQALKGLARTKVKSLRDIAHRSGTELELELDRLSTLSDHKLSVADRAYLLDAADFYDIWFREEK
jgi:hypothetical protein